MNLDALRNLGNRALAVVKARAALSHAYRDVFVKHPSGDAVLKDILREGGVLSVSHVSGDSHDSAFNDGKRALALHIIERLRWSEMELLALAEEQTTDRLAAGTEE